MAQLIYMLRYNRYITEAANQYINVAQIHNVQSSAGIGNAYHTFVSWAESWYFNWRAL